MFQARQSHSLFSQPSPAPPLSLKSGDGFDDGDYAAFGRSVQVWLGIRLGEYKAEQMQRRVRTLAETYQCHSFQELFRGMQARTELRAAFQDTMTINVTELLRNPERFDELSRCILPPLRAQCGSATLSVWSAGCSYGAEAYSLALLLHELAPTAACRILGTDIDQNILAKAREACFTETDMGQVSPARREAHFLDLNGGQPCAGGALVPRYRPKPPLRDRVQLARHDLLADAYPQAEYHLVACRNVLIYFTEDAKECIYRGFFQSLKPGGVLFVGGTERLTDYRVIGFELVRPFFYRKPA